MKGKEGRLGYYIHKDFWGKKAQQIFVWEKPAVQNNKFYSEIICSAKTSVPKGKMYFLFVNMKYICFSESSLYVDHLSPFQKGNLERYSLYNSLINPIDISMLKY